MNIILGTVIAVTFQFPVRNNLDVYTVRKDIDNYNTYFCARVLVGLHVLYLYALSRSEHVHGMQFVAKNTVLGANFQLEHTIAFSDLSDHLTENDNRVIDTQDPLKL